MIGRFEELLHELGKILHLTLHIDKSGACSIRFHEHLTIRLQLDVSQENLIFFSKIIEIPPGKFRENVLRESLKANAERDPRTGILGYHAASNHLILFQFYPLPILNGERLAGFMGAFYEMGNAWHAAIQSGQAGPLPSRPSPFGLKP